MPVPLRFFCSVLLSAGLFLNDNQPASSSTTSIAPALPSGRWVLRAVDTTPLPAKLTAGPVTTLMLRSATEPDVTTTDCAGSFKPTLSTHVLALTQVIKTLIRFDDTAVDTEFRYLTALAQARRYEVDGTGTTLRLFDATHTTPRLTFETLPTEQ